jgi:hypothetical protein
MHQSMHISTYMQHMQSEINLSRNRGLLPPGHVAVLPQVLEQQQVRLERRRSSRHLHPKPPRCMHAYCQTHTMIDLSQCILIDPIIIIER